MSPSWQVRPAEPADLDGIVELAGTALGWGDDPRNEALFRWKHLDNPFGPSPMWVADDGGRLVGFRAMMRWAFRVGERRVSAVRAVDTATHPSARRQGVFEALTRHAVEELTTDGVDLVFNTPNDQSRPGYLKLGWQTVGRVPVGVRLRSPAAASRVLRARTAAGKWGLATDVGVAAADALADAVTVPAPGPALVTDRSGPFLAWRYGLESLGYRAEPVRGGGWLVFRLRHRGPATELVVASLLGADRSAAKRTVRRLLAATGADHALACGLGGVPAPLGPVLVTRGLAGAAPADPGGWGLELGDVELF